MSRDVKSSDDGSGTAEINDTVVNIIVEFVVSFWRWQITGAERSSNESDHRMRRFD